jgi:hypothetical protein
MGSESTVWSFIRTFRKHWFAAMSGGVSVPFAAAPAFIDNGYAQIVLALLALTAAWFAAYRVWKAERDQVIALQDRLSRKIRLFLHTDKARTTRGIEIGKSGSGAELPYIQVSAESLTDAIIKEATASIVRIEHRATPSDEFTEVWGESQVVPWSRQFGKPDLSKGNPLRFNIVSYNPTTPIPEDIVERAQQSNSLVQFYESKGRNGEYRYTVHVVGRDVLPAMAHVFVMWNPHGYPSVTLHPIEVA